MMVSPRILRMRAYSKVLAAIANGTIRRASQYDCIDCAEPATGFDHRDYTKPLQVDPVCAGCNTKRGAGFPEINGPDVDVAWITTPPRKNFSSRRFELRLTPAEFAALKRLSDKKDKGMSELIAAHIKNSAKRNGVWK